MQVNVGTWDRVIRIILAVVFAVLATRTGGVLAIILWILAVAMLVTGITARCTLYSLFGIRTCPMSPNQKNR